MFKKKKIRQIFISTIVAILFLVPMIANAATVTSGGSTGGSFTTIERYPDGGWRNFIGNINLHRTAGYGGNLYCTNPFVTFSAGEKTVMPIQNAYPAMTQSDINYVAAGVDYILNKYPLGSSMEREALAQAFVWNALSGKAGYNLSDFNMSGTGANLYSDAISKASVYANSVRNSAQGSGIVYVSGDGTQDVASFSVSYGGYLTLTKETASNRELVNLCPENYSLAGATYRVSGSPAMDQNAGELIVNADGTSNTISLPAGTYYVKEITAPKGYNLDTNVYTVTVSSGETATLRVKDEPIFDPLSFRLQKKAAETPNKELSLEGAEYTVKYYKEKTEDTSGLTPFRTWVFRTDKNGYISLGDKWKVSGDELFKDDDGTVVGLHGTYTFEETKAPAGYVKTDGIISTQIIDSDHHGQAINVLKDVVDNEKLITVEVDKVSEETAGVKTKIGGATMQLKKADGTVVETWTTEKDKTKVFKGLEAGKYILHEKKAPDGYVTAKDIEFEVLAVSEVQKIEMVDEITKTEFTKTDAKTRKLLKGATMQILDEKGKVVKEWISEEVPTKFEKLPVGKYTLHEAKAPLRYDLAPDISFEVKDTADVQSYTMADNVKIGKIIIDDKFKLRVNTGDHSNLYMFTMSFLFAAGLSVCMIMGKRKRNK
ncbi:MAG: hypothetical protein HXL94_00475 [[Eubacterium] sulci]|jgi:hypothetical protein|nr:hypothetical protein [[Eubacterium] sulci]